VYGIGSATLEIRPHLSPIHSCQGARVVRIASLDGEQAIGIVEYIVGMTLVVPSSVLVLALLETSRVDNAGRHDWHSRVKIVLYVLLPALRLAVGGLVFVNKVY
jgi:hypothetical protein